MKKRLSFILCLIVSVVCFPMTQSYATEVATSSNIEIWELEEPELEVFYDAEQKNFVYTLPNDAFFSLTMPIGSKISGTMDLTLGEGVRIYRVLKDGETMRNDGVYQFDQKGYYTLYLTSNEFGLEEGKRYGFYISFELSDEKTADVSLIYAPYGFAIKQVTYQGKELETLNERYVSLQADGYYEITFVGSGAKFVTKVDLDTTPPTILFSEDITKEIVKQELEFTILEENTELQIYRNGKEVISSKNTVVRNGTYEFVVSDELGNERIYEFKMEIEETFDLRYMILIAGIAILILTVTFCLRIWRGNVRVR